MITQKEFFKSTQTDNLLNMRFAKTCNCPVNENDKPDFNQGDGKFWYIDKSLLYDELKTRPHRVRAKDRRKNKTKY